MKLLWASLFLIAGMAFAESEKIIVLKNGEEVSFLTLELTDKGYLVSTKEGVRLVPSDSKVTFRGTSTCDATEYYSKLDKIGEKEKPEPVAQKKQDTIKWNLPCPPPKILPVKKVFG